MSLKWWFLSHWLPPTITVLACMWPSGHHVFLPMNIKTFEGGDISLKRVVNSFWKKKCSWFSYLWTCQLIKVMQDLICTCEQETFTRFINKFRLNRQSFTCKNCQTEFRRLLSVFREQLVCLFVNKPGGPVAHNLWKFGIVWSLEMNQWIALDILSFSSQISEHVKDTIHCFSVY